MIWHPFNMENAIDEELEELFWNRAFDNILQPLFLGSCGIYYEEDILRLLQSQNPENAEKLNLLLMEIVSIDNLDAFEFMILNSYKIKIINEKNQTCIHLAYYAGSWEILTASDIWLPNLSNGMITCTDTNGLTFLHIACHIADETFVEKCLSSNLNIEALFSPGVEKPNHHGFRPLHFASINHNQSILKILLQYGANVNATDSEGRTPLHVACYAYCDPIEEGFEQHLDVVKFLLENQSNLRIKDRHGNTPLLSIFPNDYKLFASHFYTLTTVPVTETKLKLELLLKQGVDLTIKNMNNESILHCIIKNLRYMRVPSDLANISFDDSDHVEMIQKILDSNPNIGVNGKNCDGETPLQVAVSYMSIDIVKLLLDNNADVNTVKFELNNSDMCFHYPMITPNLESVINIELVTRLLTQKEFQITIKENLNILKFLVHDVEKCDCYKFKSLEDIKTHFGKMINYDPLHHTIKILENICKEASDESMAMMEWVAKYLLIKKMCKFYCNSLNTEILNYFETNQFNLPPELRIEQQAEITVTKMKSEIVTDGVSLHDVMSKNPHFVHKYLKDLETYSGIVNLTSKYDSPLQDIMNGHVAHSLIRNYVVRSAFDYFDLMFPFLPEPCCKIVLDYLDEKSILDLCSAALLENFQ